MGRSIVQCGPIGLDHEGADHGLVGLTENFEAGIEGSGGGAKIDHHHLVFLVMNDLGDLASQLRPLGGVAFAEEDGILHVVPFPEQKVEELRPAFVVGNVVADEKVSTGHIWAPPAFYPL